MAENNIVYSQEAKNVLAYLFLKDFHDKFMSTLNLISEYLSNYEKYNSYFSSSEREQIVNKIKQELLSIIYILNSMNLDNESRKSVNNLIGEIDKIISTNVFTKSQLKMLLNDLSKILALSFLRDLVKYVPSISRRLRGDFD